MITIHHLGVSQSDRVVWLMEELGLPYKLVWHRRGADNLMPPSYLALHPAATAPVIQDGDRTMSEHSRAAARTRAAAARNRCAAPCCPASCPACQPREGGTGGAPAKVPAISSVV